MPLKTEGIDEPELNLTPMIDIVFLLIIFFLVGTEFADKTSVQATEDETTLINIELPTSSTETSLTPPPDPVLVSITKEGRLQMNRKDVNLEQLETGLKEAKNNYSDVAVVILGAGQADLQIVVDVLDLCQKVKIRQTKLKAKRANNSGS